jgi:hypothetical protein
MEETATAYVDWSLQGLSIANRHCDFGVFLSAPNKALCVGFATTPIYQTPDWDEGKRHTGGAALAPPSDGTADHAGRRHELDPRLVIFR